MCTVGNSLIDCLGRRPRPGLSVAGEDEVGVHGPQPIERTQRRRRVGVERPRHDHRAGLSAHDAHVTRASPLSSVGVAVEVGTGRLGVDAALAVAVASRHRNVRRIVDEDPTLLDVEQRRPVRRGEVVCREDYVGWA